RLRVTQAPSLSEQYAYIDASHGNTNKQADDHRLQQQRHQRVRPFDDDGIHTDLPRRYPALNNNVTNARIAIRPNRDLPAALASAFPFSFAASVWAFCNSLIVLGDADFFASTRARSSNCLSGSI